MGKLYLVRHAKAGERRVWKGPDIERPLSKKGWKQSALVAKRLAKAPATNLLSSPYVRCYQTLEPLGERLGLEVQIEPVLEEFEPVEPVLELLKTVPAGTVMCSHGDIIPATIKALKKQGCSIKGETDWRKASIWVLRRNKHGQIVKANVIPPPIH